MRKLQSYGPSIIVLITAIVVLLGGQFLTMAIRSLMETIVCQHLIKRRNYLSEQGLSKSYELSQVFFEKLQALRRILGKKQN